jgi:23S rRNA pseudouridine1911/1915/1917 synthase
MSQGWTYHDRIDRTTQGETVLDFYSQRYRHSSREEWQQRIQQGQILLDGDRTMPETRLQAGQQLTYHRPPWSEPEVPLTLEWLYADADLCVVVKPAGLPVLPGGGFLQHTVLWQLQQRFPQETPVPMHRLGRGTSGLLLLARSPRARAALSQQLRDRQMRKIYRALAQGTGLPEQFTVTQPIDKRAHPQLGYLYAAQDKGLVAQSEVTVLEQRQTTTLVEVNILTGRPHQIRIHLAYAGYPLVGDPLYGIGGIPRLIESPTGNIPVPSDCGYHLHAIALQCRHPSGAPLEFTCPPPTALAIGYREGGSQ